MEGGESFRQPACHGVRPLFHCPGCGRPPCVQTAPCPPCRSGRSGMALPHLQELCGRGHHPVLLFPENAVCLTWRNILCWDGGMIRRILGIAVPNGIENGLILLVSPPGAKRVRPVRGGSVRLVILILIHNLFNAFVYPFSGALASGLRAAGDVQILRQDESDALDCYVPAGGSQRGGGKTGRPVRHL